MCKLVIKILLLSSLNIIYAVNSSIEKPMVIVVPSYNNAQWYKKNLDSILFQNYSQYRVVYIDDCSTDETAQLVEEYLKLHDHNKRVVLKKNAVRVTALPNIYYAIHEAQDDEIVLLLDGDDWFPDEHTLAIVNKAYQDSTVWITYGNSKDLDEEGNEYYPCADVTQLINENIRNPDPIRGHRRLQEHFVPGHLLTFYAWLFKEIKLESLFYKGAFADISYDVAINYPLFEMARGHIMFIPELTYIHNTITQLNDHKVRPQHQIEVCKTLKKRPEYLPLLEKPLKVEMH